MRYMNDYDLEQARRRFTGQTMPNRLALVMVVDNLREWADTVSDGWAYWPKPCRAASRAMELIDSSTFRETEDIDEETMLRAVQPIKAFLTRCARERHGLHPSRPMVTAEEREIILRSVTL